MPGAVYFHYFAQFLKTRLSYRADFFAELFATGLSAVFAFSFVLVLFLPIDSLAGWGRDEVVFIYGFSLIPYGIFAMVSWNLYEFGSRFIVEGAFDRVMLRPLNSFLQVACESFRIQTLSESALGVVAMIHASNRLGLEWTAADFFWIGVSAISGALILVAVFGTLASCSFFAEDRIGIAPPVFNLIQPARYPPDLFHPAIRFLLRYVIPFHFIAFFPATLVLDREEFVASCKLAPLVAAICLVVLAGSWTLGVRNYRSTGS
jgi:ABC-2 type transport system permease protein